MGITEFLECCITNDSNKVTHTSMTGGKWYIPPKQYKKFYKVLRKAVANNEVIPPLTEKLGTYHPLIFDFDMKYNQAITEKPYNLTFLKHLSEFLWISISEVIYIDDENKYNDVYIMGKSKPYPCTKQEYKSKDGIHFLYPKIILSNEVYKLLCKTIQDKQNELLEIFKTYSLVEPSNLNDTLFDGKFTRWMPYLCHKEGEEPYKLEHVFVMAQGNA